MVLVFHRHAVYGPVIYDTMYAMVDREDDVKVGVKSTAILFDAMDKLIIALLQILFVVLLVVIGLMFTLTADLLCKRRHGWMSFLYTSNG